MTEFSVGSIDFLPLLDELESGSSGSCANVIRKLREHEVAAYEAGSGGPTGELIANFIARLDDRVACIESEIEKTCSHNYQNFVDSVGELLSVRENAEQLQNILNDIRSNIGINVTQLSESSAALLDTHTTLANVDQCITTLRNSIPVLDQYEKVEKSIAEGRYYHAMKTLEQLENYQLKSIQSCSFSESLSKRIPELRAEIKSASRAQLTDFLEEIRQHSIHLGAIAMHQTAEKTGMRDDALMITTEKTPVQPSRSFTRIRSKQSTASSDCDDSDSNNSPPANIELDRPPPPKHSVMSHQTKGSVLEAELEELVSKSHPESSSSEIDSSSDWRNSKNNIEELIDFGPIYRCLHIHAVLGERTEFENYYCAQRRKQCQLLISLLPSQQASLRNYGEFFSKIVGFFLVDDYLRHTMPGAASNYQTYVLDSWATVVATITQIVAKNAENCRTSAELLSLKHYCVLFDRTMSGLGFHTAGLIEVLESIRKRYIAVLIAQWKDKFKQIIDEDNYTAIEITSPKAMTPLLSHYPYCKAPEFVAQPYPRTLVFSLMVPQIYMAIRDYIDACFAFVQSMDMAWTELEDVLNKATNTLFADCLSSMLEATIQECESNLLRLVQLTINLNELESACEHLQTYLHEHARPRFVCNRSLTANQQFVVDPEETDDPAQSFLQADNMNVVHPSRSHLYGVSLFRDTRARAETQIYTYLNSRIEEFCSLAFYDGIFGGPGEGRATIDALIDIPTPSRTPNPSDYMVDMMKWLGSTFKAFAHLPRNVAQTACMSACKYIVRLLQNILIGPGVKMVMEPALSHLYVDVTVCNNFANSDPVPGIDKGILLLIFRELHQLLDLVKKDDWQVYFANYNKPSGNPYDRVTPIAAITLLEYMREGEKKKSSFLGSIRKGERERRKHLEDVLKQLKDLQSAAYGRK